MDWLDWHDAYDRPDSALTRRLRAVQTQIRTVLDHAAAGPVRVLSVCAGQGRDLLEVLADHPRRGDVKARLVELDARNAALAAEHTSGLDVEVVIGDASLTDQYRGLAPAHLVLMCGVFGNVTLPDIERTVDTCRQLTATGGTVIWTRTRDAPDRFPRICEWFEARDFDRVWVSEPDVGYGVGVHRYRGEPLPLKENSSMFTFVGYRELRADGLA